MLIIAFIDFGRNEITFVTTENFITFGCVWSKIGGFRVSRNSYFLLYEISAATKVIFINLIKLGFLEHSLGR
jgi:hypothetical protein